MRFKKLLVLSALCLSGSYAFAVDENVWTAPVLPTPPAVTEFAEFEYDTELYLYNVGAKLFFAQGNAWGTQVSVGTTGNVSIFLQAEGLDGVSLWTNNCSKGNGYYVFTDSKTGAFVDLGDQKDKNTGWEIKKVGDAWRICTSASVPKTIPNKSGEFNSTLVKEEGMWLGLDVSSNVANTACNPYLAEGEGAYLDWQFVSPAVYEEWSYSDELTAYNEAMDEYNEAMKPYTQAMALLKALQAAEELGINASSFEAVYNDTDSDEETLQKAVTDLQAIIDAKNTLKKYLETGAEVGAPIASAQAVYDNADATAEELKKASDAIAPMVQAREALKKALDDAKAMEFTETADFDAVFGNADATLSEVQKATTDLTAALIEWGKTHATVDKPADMTSFITNPNFDNASNAGWKGTAPNMTGSGSHGPANVAEVWNNTFDTYQEIEGLPNGIYTLSAKTSWRGSWNDMANGVGPASQLYAVAGDVEQAVPFNYIWGCMNTESMGGETYFGTGAGENNEAHDGVTYYSPNDPSAFRLYCEKGYYDTEVMFSVFDGKARIGVKNPAKLGDADNWSCFDSFKLTFFGGGADACQKYLDEAVKNYSAAEVEEGTIFTESYLTAYNEALQSEHKAANMEELAAVIESLDGGKKSLEKNIELWKTYKKKVEDAHAKYSMDERFAVYDEAGELTDYIDADIKYVGDEELPGYETIITEHALTNEELEAELAFVDGLIAAVEKAAKEGLKEGQDVTIFLENPDFESGVKRDVANPNGLSGDYGTAVGWHADKLANGNFTPGPDGKDNDPSVNHAFEAWHCHDFDFWQEVDNLQEGVYVINVQGYVRNETAGTVTEYDPSIIPIKLYMNKSTSNFPDVFSEEVAEEHYLEDGTLPKIEDWSWSEMNGSNYANSMGAAGMCFDWGMYKVETYGLVKQGETMRIGVKGKMTGDWWCIWDNFKLTYQGYNVNYVQPALDEAMASIDASKPMGKNVYSTAKGLADKAAEAKATGDGKTMFQMLADVYDAADDIRNSVELFAQLSDAIENETTGLNAAIFVSANNQAKAEAEALVGTITSGIENHDINDDEVEGLLQQIANMKTKLAMPAGWENATDENPADFTGVIVNPDYCNPETDLSYTTGWTNPGNPGNDDTQKSAQAMEFWQTNFDMYQDLQGLPKGTYIVQLDAWCRNGASGENLDQFNLDNDTTLAFIYATGEDDVTFAAPVANLMKGAQTEDPTWDGIGLETLQGVEYYLPNNLTGARAYMDPDIIAANEGVYTNKLIAKVGDDGKLRIGIKKDKKVTSSWVVLDNWKLFYCGSNSSLTPSPDITAVEAVNVEEAARVEFFSLDGRKANSAQKGVFIQKTTLSNGATIIKKIMK